MGTQHIIELNGKHYDALTGKMVVSDRPTHTPEKPKSMDGFSKPKPHPPRQVASSTKHRGEKASTLMRSTVARPKPSQTKHAPVVKSTITTTHHLDDARLSRAASVSKSKQIQRFSDATPTTSVASPRAPSSKRTATASPSAATPNTSRDQFSQALANAKSHEEPAPKHKRRLFGRKHGTSRRSKLLNSAAIVAAFLILGGFFAYQNLPSLSMRLAATRANVDGRIPSYQPAGFSMSSKVLYKPGEVSLGFRSNSDPSREFKVTQTASEWDSQGLHDNYVASQFANDSQVVQDKGKTVYIYKDNNATWVDRGIWFKIEGNSGLNSDQLLRLANSL